MKSGDEMERPLSRTKKNVIVFVLCALVLQGIFCLLFTTGALEKLFPLYVRFAAQDVVCGDNSYTEYFKLRRDAEEMDVIVVGMDFTSPATFTLLQDMIVSLKHDINIGGVVIDAYGDSISSQYAARCVDSIMPGEAEFHCNEIRFYHEVTPEYEAFLDGFRALNESYPPQNRLFGVTVPESEDHVSAVLDAIHNAHTESGRPVLVLTEDARLAKNGRFRMEAEKSAEDYMFIRCFTTNGAWDRVFPVHTTAVYLVEQDDLRFFDSLYSVASTWTNGEKSVYTYTEAFSTEIFFVVTDGEEDVKASEQEEST